MRWALAAEPLMELSGARSSWLPPRAEGFVRFAWRQRYPAEIREEGPCLRGPVVASRPGSFEEDFKIGGRLQYPRLLHRFLDVQTYQHLGRGGVRERIVAHEELLFELPGSRPTRALSHASGRRPANGPLGGADCVIAIRPEPCSNGENRRVAYHHRYIDAVLADGNGRLPWIEEERIGGLDGHCQETARPGLPHTRGSTEEITHCLASRGACQSAP